MRSGAGEGSSVSQRGTRVIDGRYYDLFYAMNWWGYGSGSDEEEELAREERAARSRYEYVRVIKDKRRFRAYIYVL